MLESERHQMGYCSENIGISPTRGISFVFDHITTDTIQMNMDVLSPPVDYCWVITVRKNCSGAASYLVLDRDHKQLSPTQQSHTETCGLILCLLTFFLHYPLSTMLHPAILCLFLNFPTTTIYWLCFFSERESNYHDSAEEDSGPQSA